MPIFETYTKEGKLITSHDEILSDQNLSHYITQNGMERAEGYKDAMNDLINSIEKILFSNSNPKTGYLLSPSNVRTSLRSFYKERSAFLNTLNKFSQQSDKPSLDQNSDSKLTI